MTLPPQSAIELPLLQALSNLGGSASPQEVYKEIKQFFPQLTERDLEKRLPSSPTTYHWHNRVQWVRQALVAGGYMSRGQRGLWQITEKGREKLAAAPTIVVTPPVLKAVDVLKEILFGYQEEYSRDNSVSNAAVKALKERAKLVFADFGKYYGLRIKIIGGQTRLPKSPYISFCSPGHTVSRGIYPIIGFDFSDRSITLKIGDSSDNPPPDELVSILQARFEILLPNFKRENGAYPGRTYQIEDLTDESFEEDLKEMVQAYLDVMDELQVELAAFLSEPSEDTESSEDGSPEDLNSKQIWLLAAGQGGSMLSNFLETNSVAVGWDELGDLSRYRTKKDIADFLSTNVFPGKAKGFAAKSCFDFASIVKPGDIIFLRSGLWNVEAVALVEGNNQFEPSLSRYKNRRKVRWLKIGPWEIPENFPMKQFGQQTLVNISNAAEIVDSLYTLTAISEDNNAKPVVSNPAYSIEDALKDVFIDREEFESILDSLQTKKNIVLQGPPGAGKTFLASRLAAAFVGSTAEHLVETVQFHQSYSYEDFVQGIRPDAKGGFSVKDGIFFSFCERAQNDPDAKFVLIIDEINRGNVSRIFGELLLLIENDKRGKGHKVRLTYHNYPFSVPENVFLIATMNTADRSLALLDFALRRRFRFFDIKPRLASNQFEQHLASKRVPSDQVRRLVQRVGALNEKISLDKNLGPGYQIGHSHFVIHDEVSDSKKWYEEIIKYEIAPLLREYWFEESEKVDVEVAKLLD